MFAGATLAWWSSGSNTRNQVATRRRAVESGLAPAEAALQRDHAEDGDGREPGAGEKRGGGAYVLPKLAGERARRDEGGAGGEVEDAERRAAQARGRRVGDQGGEEPL